MPAQLNDAITLHFVLHLKDDTIARFTPSPLKPAIPSRAHFIANHFRKTTLPGVDNYRESAILLDVQYNGIRGSLTLAILLDDDNAMIGGREFFGFPKKMGLIKFNYDENSLSGEVSRRNTIIARFSAQTGEMQADPQDIKGPFGDLCYNIKCFPDPGLRRFDYPPRLIGHTIAEKRKNTWKLDDMHLELFSSAFDPWSEIEPFEIIAGYKHEYDCTVQAGEVIAELDGDEYFKYALNRFI